MRARGGSDPPHTHATRISNLVGWIPAKEVTLSVLTKVFVVLVAILSVMLVALIVPFVANTQNYRQMADDARLQARMADESADLMKRQVEALEKGDTEKVVNLTNELQGLKDKFQVLQQQVAEKDAQVIRMRAQVGALEADRARLAASNQQLSQLLAKQNAELESRREQMVSLRSDMIDAETRITELEAQLATAERAVRRTREQMTRLEEEKSKLEELWNRVPVEARPTLQGQGQATSLTAAEFWPDLSKPLIGEVTEVQQEAGETFVQINLGSNDGIEPNMLMLVHRGDQYLGTLVITSVDQRQSAGRMKLVKNGVEIAM